MGDYSLSDVEFNVLRDLVYARTGIRFDEQKRTYVEKRVSDRMRRCGDTSGQRYISWLKTDGNHGELQALINTLTVNETYFFREDYQFRCLTSSLLPEITATSRRKSLRIWSLPCSTGDEPYSIAIRLLESFDGVDDYDIEIMGSDLDTAVLASCEEARYSQRSLQHVPANLLQRYFEPLSDGKWRVCEGLRDSVTFTQCSLVDRTQMLRHGRFDVVFCRNVLIYFDAVSRRLAADNIYEVLHPGGFICLGHSESMSRISASFDVRKFQEAIVYQRPNRDG